MAEKSALGPLYFGTSRAAVWYNCFTILLTNSVKQGDPLGRFSFSVGIQPIISRLKRKHGATMQLWNLDDEVITDRLSDLDFFFDELAT